MRVLRIAAHVVPAVLLIVSLGAQDRGGPRGGTEKGSVAHLDATTDAFFALNGYTFMALLHLRPDGTFAEYAREHMFVAITDEGRWRQADNGTVLLCSHYNYESVTAGRLHVSVSADDVPRLPVLARAIENRLQAAPTKRRFAAGDLKPVLFRSWLSEDSLNARVKRGWIPLPVEGEERTASREDLRSLVAAIGDRLANRDGSLVARTVMRLGDLVWLSEAHGSIEKELLEEYRAHKSGPFLSGVASVAVDARTFEELLGTRQPFMHFKEMNQEIPRETTVEDFRRKRLEVPECGIHQDLARPLRASKTGEASNGKD